MVSFSAVFLFSHDSRFCCRACTRGQNRSRPPQVLQCRAVSCARHVLPCAALAATAPTSAVGRGSPCLDPGFLQHPVMNVVCAKTHHGGNTSTEAGQKECTSMHLSGMHVYAQMCSFPAFNVTGSPLWMGPLGASFITATPHTSPRPRLITSSNNMRPRGVCTGTETCECITCSTPCNPTRRPWPGWQLC